MWQGGGDDVQRDRPKPEKTQFVRTNPNEEFWQFVGLIELKTKNGTELYAVPNSLHAKLAAEPAFSRYLLISSVTRDGVKFLWPIRDQPEGRSDNWGRSALEAARLAKTNWVRVSANMTAGHYETKIALGDIPDPVFGDAGFWELVGVAFKGRVIDSLDHPVLKKLRGEV